MTTQDERPNKKIAERCMFGFPMKPEALGFHALQIVMTQVEEALDSAEKRGREAGIEVALKTVNEVACNANAKYTCCLENGLNAKNIIESAIRRLK